MEEVKDTQKEKLAVIIETHQGSVKIVGATNSSLVEGALHLLRTTKTTRTEPVSFLWGLYKSERKVVDTKNEILATFASGSWISMVAEGALVDEPAAAPVKRGRRAKAK
jgi:hypothetical protein